jgi:hypothetical protein
VKPLLFKTEADLCDAFIAEVKRRPGWTAYPETEGWDILLSHADGTQVGIQAKLRLNFEVVAQCLEEGRWPQEIGPDFRAVLVPAINAGFDVCHAVGITVIYPIQRFATVGERIEFQPDLDRNTWERWHYMNPGKRHELPAYVPDVRAGVPGPAQLTKWKISALEVCAVLELRGYVTREDFRHASIDHRRWVEGWLEPVPNRAGTWRWKDGAARFVDQHPTIYAEIREKVKKRGVTLAEVVDLAGPTRLI